MANIEQDLEERRDRDRHQSNNGFLFLSRSAKNPFGGALGKQTARLFQTIEGEILPRLMLVQKSPDKPAILDQDPKVSEDQIRAFQLCVLQQDDKAALDFMAALEADGVPHSAILVELIGGLARRFGAMWESDEMEFADVTIGVCKLHRLLRMKTARYRAFAEALTGARRILVATANGDQHTLGSAVVAEIFRDSGWGVNNAAGKSSNEVAQLLRREYFDVLGLSASSEVAAGDIATEIRDVKKASRNKGLRVVVGGPLFQKDPGLAETVGADACIVDARAAPAMAERIIAARQNIL